MWRTTRSKDAAAWCFVLATATLLTGCGASLHDTVGRGDLEAVREILAAHPDWVHARNKLDKTPLHYAVNYKRIEAMGLLLEAGADINAADTTGMTPLHVAAMLGRKGEATWLLERGARPDTKDKFGDTPIHTAAIFGQGHLVKLLLSKGADLSAKNTAGMTPLDLARKNRQERAAKYIEKLQASASE